VKDARDDTVACNSKLSALGSEWSTELLEIKSERVSVWKIKMCQSSQKQHRKTAEITESDIHDPAN